MKGRYVKLDEICSKASSNIAQKDLLGKNGNYPIYGASGYISNIDFYQQEESYIAIVKDGAGIGRAMLLPPKSSVIGTLQYIIPDKSQVEIEYLFYAITYLDLSRYYSGATIPHIYFKDYKNETFYLPERDQQRKIAAILCKIDQLIETREKQFNYYDNLVKSRFIELFGDIENNSKNFSVQSIAEVSEELFAGGDKPSDNSLEKNGEYQYPVYSNGEGPNGLLCFSRDYRVSKEAITISARGAIGYSAIRAPFFTPVVRLLTVVPKACIDIIYLKYYIDASKLTSTGTSQGQLTVPEFKKLMVLVPPKELQKQFAAFVVQTDKSKFAIQQSLEKLEILKKSLMQQYFE